MEKFSKIILVVNKECGDNLLNPTDDDIINGIGKDTLKEFCQNGFIHKKSRYIKECNDAYDNINKNVILNEIRMQLDCILRDYDEKDGDMSFDISGIKSCSVVEHIIHHILDMHGENSYLLTIDSIHSDDKISNGNYIDNAFSRYEDRPTL